MASAIESQWTNNCNAENAAGIARMFATDGSFVTPSGAVLTGPSAIENAIAARMKAGWTKESVTIREAHVTGNAMWIVGEYALVGSGPNSGKQIGGHFMKVLTQDAGEWHIRTLIANAPPPVAPPATSSAR